MVIALGPVAAVTLVLLLDIQKIFDFFTQEQFEFVLNQMSANIFK